jgi:hypothetical protein
MPSSHVLVARAARLSSLAVLFIASNAAAQRPKTDAPATAPKPAADTTSQPSVASKTIEARIVGIEEENLVIDVGSRAGVTVGQLVELWRPLKLRNPATGKTVEDRYRTGSLRVTEVLEVMSFAKAEGTPRRPPQPGDIVTLRVEQKVQPVAPPAAVPVASQRAGASAPPPVPADPDAASLATLIQSLYAASLEDRVQKYEAWLRQHPSSRFAGSVSQELDLLRRLSQAPTASSITEAPATASLQAEHEAEASPVIRFKPPDAAYAGASLDFGIELGGALRGAVLHSRGVGEVAYVSTPMRPAGSGFWVATVPGHRVRAPKLDYFIEVVRPDGTATAVIGDVIEPLRIKIVNPPKPSPPLHHRSIVSAYTDYADYNRLRGNDTVWQTEGVFGMRFADIGVRAVRSGFGVYRGVGGSIDELDVQGLPPRRVGLTYGHLEGEFGFSATTSLIARALVGLGDTGVTGGGQALLRIGNDLETNLLLGGEVLGGIGLRGIAELQLYPQSRVPVVIRTEVTNQPAGSAPTAPTANESTGNSEIGGRAIVQAGYRVFDPLVVFARLSYQGRTISHSGPGFGGGVTFEW